MSGRVPIYTEAELIKLIEQNKRLEQCWADNCQLVEDIVARATGSTYLHAIFVRW